MTDQHQKLNGREESVRKCMTSVAVGPCFPPLCFLPRGTG